MPVLKDWPPRVDFGDLLAIGGLDGFEAQPEHVHFHAGRQQGDLGLHVPRDTRGGVEGDRRPDHVDLVLRDALARQERPRGVGAVHLEAFRLARIGGHEAHVVEHRGGIEQFRVVGEPLGVAGQGAEQEHAARVVVEQVGLGVADQVGDLASQGAVGDGDAGDGGHGGEASWDGEPLHRAPTPS